MPQIDEKPNKIADKRDIKPDNIRLINRRLQVTARWLAARFQIPFCHLISALDDVQDDSDLAADHDDQGNIWIDSAIFYDLSIHPLLMDCISEAAQQATLQLLGMFERKEGGS